MNTKTAPIRVVRGENALLLLTASCGDPFPLRGHTEHRVVGKLMEFDNELGTRCTIRCQCGRVFYAGLRP